MLQIALVKIANCICPNFKLYLCNTTHGGAVVGKERYRERLRVICCRCCRLYKSMCLSQNIWHQELVQLAKSVVSGFNVIDKPYCKGLFRFVKRGTIVRDLCDTMDN